MENESDDDEKDVNFKQYSKEQTLILNNKVKRDTCIGTTLYEY